MCRFIAYFGKNEILLDDLIGKPDNSLVRQSLSARVGVHRVNADGFGIAWYDLKLDNEPGIFKSTQPAWNDYNLISICKKVKSSCFLAHVRASTVGDVAKNNSHPFSYGEYSLVHNGTIEKFNHIKRALLNKIEDEYLFKIRGNTDSEHLFYLIMHFLNKHNHDMILAVKNAIAWIVRHQAKLDGSAFSSINIAFTNGRELIGTRFITEGHPPLSLNYTFKSKNAKVESFTLSSEPLSSTTEQWHTVPKNHYIYLNAKDMEIKIDKL